MPRSAGPTRRYEIGAATFEAEPLATGLHIVATPIGNLGDVTLRALETLAAADTILCEDTRETAKLLARYGIRNRLEAYHEHNAERVRPRILARLKEGAALTLASDAGMPLISDPGFRLAAEAQSQGTPVTCCPGPSAVLAALALSGLPTDRFAFLGFLPHKAGERRRLFAELAPLRASLVFFESPKRLVATLRELSVVLPGRAVAVARELTKLREEVLRGSAAGIADKLAARASVRGEITLVVGPPKETGAASEDEVAAAIAEALAAMPASKAASDVARRFGLSRSEIYARILALKGTAHD